MKSKTVKPPQTYKRFVKRYPDLEKAWECINRAGKNAGDLDTKTQRLVKLGVSVGALREGAIRSGVRKSMAIGVKRKEIEQVIALAAGTIGMPATVAVFSWVEDVLKSKK